MSKYTIILLALVCVSGSASAMAGGPAFIVPPQMTSMNVEGGQLMSELAGGAGTSATDQLSSQRVSLTARYGLAPGVDAGLSVGSANLTFSELSGDYGDFTSNWSLAWGANVHVGLPTTDTPYQVVGSLHYFGFQPGGKTSNGMKSIDSKYTWHEVTPVLIGGYRFGSLIPYLGVSKPFLFGEKSVKVSFNGQEYASAGGKLNYTDAEQSFRGLFGLEWKLPEGYSLNAEAAASMEGHWTLSLGLAQVLR
ncbi:hypothetical protein HZB60_06545 [candidate division KSB1 bacterium]|nr:hypothetical protein [candidate division KSB1 bacterium]